MSTTLEAGVARTPAARHTLAYEIYGDRTKPVCLVLGGISATRHLLHDPEIPHSGWWNGIIGRGRALHTDARCLIGVDFAGARGDSAGSLVDGDGSTYDHARLILNTLDAAGVAVVDSIVAASFGGMVALALCEIAPERVRRAVIIAAAHRSDPMSTALRSLQRRIVRLGQGNRDERESLAVARGLAVTSYRTAEEFRARFGEDPGGVDSYLHHQGERFAESFLADGFLTLSRALDTHCIDPSLIRTPITLIGFDSDTLVPPAQLRELHRSLPCSTLTLLPSRYGHDGFLKESAALNPIIARAIRGTDARASAETLTARAAIATDAQHGAVIPPLHLSTTYTFEEFGRARKYDYTRSGNPTRDQLASAIAELEGAADGVVTATGMSAVLLPLQLLQPGDLLLAPHDCYGGTHRLLHALARRNAFTLDVADFTTDSVCDVIRERRPRMVWIETPSNPLLRITDVRAVCECAHRIGAIVVADNTFLSPALQRPLQLGADVVVHSTTKYINGHSDVVGGAVVARDKDVHAELAWWANCLGITGSPFDSWLTLRGLRTLHVRLKTQEASAREIAEYLETHPAVSRVYYPGLASHPQHQLARAQQTGFGAMLSFELHGGSDAARAFVDGLAHISLAESLGGVESLIAHPATMTHASMSAEARQRAGISDALLRLSVGLESAGDLIDDISAGLERASLSPGYLHSYQLEPVPVTTSSGTSSGNAPSMSSFTSADVSASSDCGISNSSSSCT
jgi:cystathionine gamma-synthase